MLRVLDVTKVVVLASGSLLDDREAWGRLDNAVRAHDVLVLRMPKGEPDLQVLQPVIAGLCRFGPDWIVAVGGGSVLDAAKLAWVLYEHPDADLGRLTRSSSVPQLRGRARFAAIPTTAGTGSEVSSSTLFVERAGCGKSVLVSHQLLPDLVVLDPGLTVSVPRDTAAAAGLDALAHAIEGYVSRLENPLADLMAEQAVRVLLAELAATVEDPTDLERRLRVMHAALMAGWVQNLKVPGVGHALAHQLARFGLPHGRCTGALLSPAVRYNSADAAVAEKYERLGATLGVDGVAGLLERIDALCHDFDITCPPLAEIVTERPELARAALDDPCARANPRPLDEHAIISILENAALSR